MTKSRGQLRKLNVGDILQLPADFAAGADFTYTDPPWGQGLVKMFETYLEKSGGVRPGNSIEAILERLFELAPRNRPVYVEYSVSKIGEVFAASKATGRKASWIHEAFYSGGTQVIVGFDTSCPKPTMKKSWDALMEIAEFHRGQTVFDPFGGLGKLASAFANFGCDVIANELTRDRAIKLAARFGCTI